MKKSMRLGALAAAVAATLALSGCGRSADENTDTGAASTIGSAPATGEVTMWAMGAEGSALPAFVKEFEEQNPDVTLNVTAIPWDAAHNKFQTAIAGGSTPDIAMMGSTWMADFSDAFATVPTDLETSDFFPGALATNMVDDRATGVPWYVDTRVLYYRTDLAEQAGWTNAPSTWDELKQMAADLQSKAGAKWGMNMPVGTGTFQSSLWMPWSNGADLTDGTSWTLDTPQMQEAFEYYESFYAEGIVNPDGDFEAAAAFVDGSSPMFIEGPFMSYQIDALGGPDFASKYTTAVLPTKESSTSFSGGANLVVFKDSDNASSAWKLAKWLSDPETQASWFETSGDLPAAQSAWELEPLVSEASVASYGEQLKTAQSVPATSAWEKVASTGDSLLEQIRRGTTSVPDALKELQNAADSIGTD